MCLAPDRICCMLVYDVYPVLLAAHGQISSIAHKYFLLNGRWLPLTKQVLLL